MFTVEEEPRAESVKLLDSRELLFMLWSSLPHDAVGANVGAAQMERRQTQRRLHW